MVNPILKKINWIKGGLTKTFEISPFESCIIFLVYYRLSISVSLPLINTALSAFYVTLIPSMLLVLLKIITSGTANRQRRELEKVTIKSLSENCYLSTCISLSLKKGRICNTINWTKIIMIACTRRSCLPPLTT